MTLDLSLRAGEIRKLPSRRARIQDDLTADWLAMAVRPGDRTVQIGGGELGAVCVKRGARHEMVGPLGAIEGLQAACDRRGIPSDTLRGGLRPRPQAEEGPIDLAIIGAESGFPALAAHWREIAAQLKQGGVLVLLGANRGAAARLSDALENDPAWVLQDQISGETAIFRKAMSVTAHDAREALSSVADPALKPRGLRRPGMMAKVRAFFAAGRTPASKAQA